MDNINNISNLKVALILLFSILFINLIQIYYVGLDGYVSIYDYFIMVLSPKDISEKIIYIFKNLFKLPETTTIISEYTRVPDNIATYSAPISGTDWIIHYNENGSVYYTNNNTNERLLQLPESISLQMALNIDENNSSSLPCTDWTIHFDTFGRLFYFNSIKV